MLRDLPVRDLMIGDVLTFDPDQNVQEAMRALVERSVNGAPVVDADGRVVGVLSVGDLILEEARLHFPTMATFFGVNVALPWHDRQLDADVSKALGTYVREVMTSEPVTVSPESTIEDATTAMHDRKVSRLPVVDDEGRLVGLITRTDILRAMVRGFDEPGAYDPGDEDPGSLGEPAAPDVDLAAREHRQAVESRQAGITGTGPANPDDRDHGAEIGSI